MDKLHDICIQSSLERPESYQEALRAWQGKTYGNNALYGNKYKYVLSGIDVASTYKVARPVKTIQAKDVVEMIDKIYKVGPLIYPKIFQCR